MDLLGIIQLGLFFLIPSSCFIFGLVNAIKYALTDNRQKFEQCAWISTLGFVACLLLIAYMLT